jgi:hypothetical protein
MKHAEKTHQCVAMKERLTITVMWKIQQDSQQFNLL